MEEVTSPYADFINRIFKADLFQADLLLQKNQNLFNRDLLKTAADVLNSGLETDQEENRHEHFTMFIKIEMECRNYWTKKLIKDSSKNNKIEWASIHYYSATIYLHLYENHKFGNLHLAIDLFQKALFVTETYTKKSFIIKLYDYLAQCYSLLQEGDKAYTNYKAIEYYRLALKYINPEKEKIKYTTFLNNIVTRYLKGAQVGVLDNAEEAIRILNEILVLWKESSLFGAVATMQLGTAYFVRARQSDHNFSLSKEKFLIAINFFDKSKHPIQWAESRLNYCITCLEPLQSISPDETNNVLRYMRQIRPFFEKKEMWDHLVRLETAQISFRLNNLPKTAELLNNAISTLSHILDKSEGKLSSDILLSLYYNLSTLLGNQLIKENAEAHNLLATIYNKGPQFNLELWASSMHTLLTNYRKYLSFETINHFFEVTSATVHKLNDYEDLRAKAYLLITLAEIRFISQESNEDFENGIDLYLQAIDILGTENDQLKRHFLVVVANRLKDKEYYDQASNYYSKAISMYGKFEDGVFSILLNLAHSLFLSKKYSPKEAIYYIGPILTHLQAFKPATMSDFDAITFYTLAAMIYINDESEVHIKCLQNAHHHFQRIRGMELSESEREKVSGAAALIYQFLIDYSMQHYRHFDLLIYIELSKARLFVDKLNFPVLSYSEIQRKNPGAIEIIAKIKNLEGLIGSIQQEINSIIYSQVDKSVERINFLRDELKNLQKRLGENNQLLQKTYSINDPSGFSGFVEISELFSFSEELRCPLVEYFKTNYGWLVLVVYNNELCVKLLSTDADVVLEKSIKRINGFKTTAGKNEELSLKKICREMYQMFFEPILEFLPDKNKLLISPTGELNLFPFNLMLDSEGKYIIQKYNISLVSSFSAGIFLSKLKNNVSEMKSAVAITVRGVSNQYLPNAQFETEVIKHTFPNSCKILFEKQATVAAFQKIANKENIDIFHFACHSKFQSDTPSMSGLSLYTSDLTISKIVHDIHFVNSPIVVLGACETAKWAIGNGNEMLGITGAFIFAGAKAVIANLWEIDDDASQFFFKSFYSSVKKGNLYFDAFGIAILELKRSEKFSKAFYWAGFIFHGLTNF